MTASAAQRRKVTVERVIAMPPDLIFDVLADPSQHPVIDGSGTVRASSPNNPQRLSLGAKFGMSMRIGLPYPVRNTVVEYEENRRIAWTHIGGQRWIYELEPVEGGTRVRETFDYSSSVSPRLYEWLRFPGRNREGMERTLERLDRHVTGGA